MYLSRLGCLLLSAVLLINRAESQGANMTGLRSHPCVLVNVETLPLVRAKAADATDTAFGFKTSAVWAGIKARADKLAAADTYRYQVAIPGNKNVILEHWEYTLSDQTPPRHDKSRAYPPWTAMFQEREDSITTRLVHFSAACLVTGEPRYFDKAKEIALHLTHWDQWTDPSYGSRALKCCLDTGHCMYAVGLFYDWCFDRLSEAERAQLREALINRGILPSLAGVDRYPADTNGYAVITAGAGLAALAIRPEEPRAGEWLQACLDKTRVSLDRGGKDGGTFEGPMYGTYLLDSFALFFDGLVSAHVQHDLFDHPYLATMDRYCIGLLAPDTKQIPCFSDGGPGVAVPQLMSILAQRGSTDAAWYLQQINAVRPETIYDFIRFDGSKLRPQEPTWIPSTVFYDIGYASLREGFNRDAPSLFFKAGPSTNNIGHNHFDHNSFVISYGGQWLIPDRGYHSFYDPAKRKFSLGSLGHCTMVMDLDEAYFSDQTVPAPGREQVKRTGGRIVEFFGGRFFDFVKGAAAEAYNTDQRAVLDRFDRSIVYLKPHLFVIRDQLAAPAPHRYNFLLHSDANGEITHERDAFLVTRGNGQALTRIFSPAKLTPHIGLYPGAETYGPFLRAETEPVANTTLLTAIYPRPYMADNYLRNGSFEKGMQGWTPRAGEDLPNHRIETVGAFEGQQCARIASSGYYYSDKFDLPPGTKVNVKAMVRTTGIAQGRGPTITLHFWAGGKAISDRRIGPFTHQEWAEQKLDAVVPKGTELTSVALEFSGQGQAWFDSIRLTTNLPLPEILTPEMKPLGDAGLAVTVGQDRYVVSFGEPGKNRQVGELVTDAELAVVRLSAGKPARVMVHKGTMVSYQGRELAKYPEATTAEVETRP